MKLLERANPTRNTLRSAQGHGHVVLHRRLLRF